MPLDVGETLHSVECRGLYSRYVAYRDRLNFQSDERTGTCELFGLTPGMLMLVVDVRPTQDYHARLFGQDILEFHFRVSGSLEMAGQWGGLCMRDPSLLLWYQPSGYDDVQEVLGSPARKREVWVSLYCDLTWIREAVDDRHRPVIEALTGERDDEGPRYQLLPHVEAPNALLQDLIRNPYEGTMRTIYARGKGLQLMCDSLSMLRSASAGGGRSARRTSRDRDALRDASDILMKEFMSPPDLHTLARRVGLSTARLCSGFHKEFGETTTGFLRRRRLDQAKAMLAESDLQVQQVAERVGYRHHSTFTAAFTRHFGVPPKAKRLRK